MTEDNVLDTAIREPAMTVGEIDMLLFVLDRSRAQFAWKCGGLGAAERCRAAMTHVLAEGGLDQPAKFTTRSGQSPNLRRMRGDMHDEYARHVGHADLLREAVDGLAGEDPPQS